MCAAETTSDGLSQLDRAAINRTIASLTALLRAPSSDSPAVTVALDALLNIRRRLTNAHNARTKFAKQTERYETAVAAANACQHRVERDIIETKMRSGELLSLRDTVARDLARVKKQLRDTDPLVEADVSVGRTSGNSSSSGDSARERVSKGGMTDESATMPDTGRTVGDGQEGARDALVGIPTEQLTLIVQNEMAQLKIAEDQLMQLFDESNAIKKRREELRRKVRVAQEEW